MLVTRILLLSIVDYKPLPDDMLHDCGKRKKPQFEILERKAAAKDKLYATVVLPVGTSALSLHSERNLTNQQTESI